MQRTSRPGVQNASNAQLSPLVGRDDSDGSLQWDMKKTQKPYVQLQHVLEAHTAGDVNKEASCVARWGRVEENPL